MGYYEMSFIPKMKLFLKKVFILNLKIVIWNLLENKKNYNYLLEDFTSCTKICCELQFAHPCVKGQLLAVFQTCL